MDLASAPTVVDVLARRAAAAPGTVWFELFDEPMSYGRLWDLSRRYGAGLASAGVGSGDRVIILLPTCPEFFAVFFGTMALGAVPVPLYPTFGAAELTAIFTHAEPRAVVSIGWFETTTSSSPDGRTWWAPRR